MENLNKVYVGNFPFSWSESDLEQLFSDFQDNITEIKIIYDKFSGRSKGFAFVTFDNEEAAQEAISLSGTQAGDRDLIISEARPPKEKSFSGDRDRGGFRQNRSRYGR